MMITLGRISGEETHLYCVASKFNLLHIVLPQNKTAMYSETLICRDISKTEISSECYSNPLSSYRSSDSNSD